MVLNCSALSGKKPGSIREKVRKIKLKELCRLRTVEGHMWEIAGRLRADPRLIGGRFAPEIPPAV